MYIEKNAFVKKKMFKHGFKFSAKWSEKKVMLTVFFWHEKTITIDFLENGAIVKSASYCQHLRQNSSHLLNDPYLKVKENKTKFFSQKVLPWIIVTVKLQVALFPALSNAV